MKTEIILASASPRRKRLLEQIGMTFKIHHPNVNEDFNPSMRPEDIVMDISVRKAKDIAKICRENSLIIGADTIVFKDMIMGKPIDEQEAFSMLKSLQGSWHEVITGLSILENRNSVCSTCFEKTRVKMRNLSDEEIKSYIKTGEPFDKAGAYGIQGIGAVLIEKIDGCYFNVVGLPLMKLSVMMKNAGIGVL